MRLGKFWKDRVTAFEVSPDTWRPKTDRLWKKFVRAACRLKLEKDQSIKIYQLSPFSKGDFKRMKKSVFESQHGILTKRTKRLLKDE